MPAQVGLVVMGGVEVRVIDGVVCARYDDWRRCAICGDDMINRDTRSARLAEGAEIICEECERRLRVLGYGDCEVCGEFCAGVHQWRGRMVCRDCFAICSEFEFTRGGVVLRRQEDLSGCALCGSEWIRAGEEAWMNLNGLWGSHGNEYFPVCERCRRWLVLFCGYGTCAGCEGAAPLVAEIDDGRVCEQCGERARTCGRCGRLRAGANLWWHEDLDEWICIDCRGKVRVYCSVCGAQVELQDSDLLEDGRGICTDCMDRVEAADDYWNDESWIEGVHNYSYKPFPVFHGRSKVFLGVELEMKGEVTQELVSELLKESGGEDLFYLKRDSSVDLELVTHPCDLEFHEKEFPWRRVMEIIREFGMYADRRTGLHLHVSKEAFGESEEEQEETEAKVLVLLNNMASHYAVVCGRGRNNYCRPRELEKKDNGVVDEFKEKKGSWTRYGVMNFEPEKTVEFRQGKAVYDAEKLVEFLRFHVDLIRFAREHSLGECLGAGKEEFETWRKGLRESVSS